MKLDVSYTDHSHIIGKGGLTIKRVMEETGCHIHFPDSNRSNHQDKSNQVSIAGEMESVERARARVRVRFLRARRVSRMSQKTYNFNARITPHEYRILAIEMLYKNSIISRIFTIFICIRCDRKLHATDAECYYILREDKILISQLIERRR